jgi:hypothetical protein
MLSFIAGLQLPDLASITGNYSRYDLDAQSRIRAQGPGWMVDLARLHRTSREKQNAGDAIERRAWQQEN